MPSQLSKRPQNPPIYGAGQLQTVNIDRGDVLRRLTLNLKQALTCTAANNTVAKTLPGDDWAAVSRVTLRANGSDILFSAPGQALPWLNYFLSGGKNPQMNLNLGDGATANAPLDTSVYIDFEPAINAKPSDTWLNTAPLNALNLDIQWAANWLAVNGSATAYTTPPSMAVTGQFGSLGFKTTGTPPNTVTTPVFPPVGMRIITLTQAIAGANANYRFTLDSGKFSYRGIIIQATTTASPAVDTPALFTNVKAINGSVTYFNQPEDQLNSESYFAFNRNEIKTTAGIPYDTTPRVSGSSSKSGWYFIDFCPDGRLSEAVPTNNTDQFYLEFNIASACTLNLYPIQLLNLTNGNPTG